MNWKQVPPKQLKEPHLMPVDFFTVLKSVKPSVDPKELGRYHEWTEQFGLEGA
jgi:Vps4 C terminal oligomerisation domain